MKKTIKVTHIDTGGHGYLSVSKKDILLVGLDTSEISGYSGMNFKRVYLEEDLDASLFMDRAKKNGFQVIVKQGYNLNFSIHHNYVASLFHLEGTYGESFLMYDDCVYTITKVHPYIAVEGLNGKKYRLLKSNPFAHIKGAVK